MCSIGGYEIWVSKAHKRSSPGLNFRSNPFYTVYSIQPWPKVLRKNTNVSQSLLPQCLDIFVRCYYGILKYNYKHFISVKGFYWQLHEVDAKSQYLQCWHSFFKTSAICLGMLSINFWATSWLMTAHSCKINAWSSSEFAFCCLSTRLGSFPAMDPKYKCFVPRAT